MPIEATVDLAAAIKLRAVAIILDPATESFVLAKVLLDLVIIAVAHVSIEEAPALRVANMEHVAIDLLSVADMEHEAIDLLSVASIVPAVAMALLDVDSTIELPNDLLVGPTLAAVSRMVVVVVTMLLELAMAPVLPLVIAVRVIFIEPDALEPCLVVAPGTLEMYQLASADSKKSRPRVTKKRALMKFQDATSR